MRLVLALLLVASCVGSVSGDIVLSIDGPNPSSGTFWDLSGGGAVSSDFSVTSLEYTGIGEIYPLSNTLFATSGSASFTNVDTSESVAVSSVYLSNANNGTIRFNLGGSLSFTTGQTLLAQSTDWQFIIDRSSLSFQGYPYSTLDNSSSIGAPALDLYVGPGAPVAVPETSQVVMLGLISVVGVCWYIASRRN